jgi:hypothetical protein
LVLALAMFTFEDGVHSVHHLPDHAGATPCAVAAASTHVCATAVEAMPVERPIARASDGPGDPCCVQPDLQPLRPDQSRAPPLPSGHAQG